MRMKSGGEAEAPVMLTKTCLTVSRPIPVPLREICCIFDDRLLISND
jgi:hypothetical protein